MSRITIEDLDLEKQNKTIRKLIKKLGELSILEKELNAEGFTVVISPIKKKD